MADSASTDRTVYRIPNWDKDFETHRSRELVRPTKFLWSNRLDGDWYLDIMALPDGSACLGGYAALLMTAAQCNPRGWLIREDGAPHTAETLAHKTRFPTSDMARYLEVLQKFCLVESVPFAKEQAKPQLVNGAATVPPKTKTEATDTEAASDPEFESWSKHWEEVTGKRTYDADARKAWHKHVAPLPDRTPFYACSENYLASAEVRKPDAAVMNRDKWIRKNAEDHWQGRWPPMKVDARVATASSGAAGIAERTNELVKQRIARGQRPL